MNGLSTAGVTDDVLVRSHSLNNAFCTIAMQVPFASASPLWSRSMTTPADRLRQARERAGYATAVQAAEAMGLKSPTYIQHENGTRGFPASKAALYGRRFRVAPEWLLYGKGDAQQQPDATVPVVGYVKAGAEAVLYAEGQGPFDYVPAPSNATDKTVAVEIRGESLGPFFNEWLVFYDDVHSPVAESLYRELCVCGLADGRVLIKRIVPTSEPSIFHLESQTEGTIYDQAVAWAAKVKGMRPR